jgi:hypothetical protein
MGIADVRVILALAAAFELCSCVPDVVSIEAVPTAKFSRDLAQCNAEVDRALVPRQSVKRCMKAKGYRFLPQH